MECAACEDDGRWSGAPLVPVGFGLFLCVRCKREQDEPEPNTEADQEYVSDVVGGL